LSGSRRFQDKFSPVSADVVKDWNVVAEKSWFLKINHIWRAWIILGGLAMGTKKGASEEAPSISAPHKAACLV
jgi:hypothetical protein